MEFYKGKISSPMTAEEEIQAFNRLKSGEKEAKNEIIKKNLALVISIAKKFSNPRINLSLEELIQEGCIGLIVACDKFDINKGYKFSTYAIWWIKHYIKDYIDNTARTIRLPIYKIEQIKQFDLEKRDLTGKLGRIPTNKELADFLKISLEELIQLSNLENPVYSLNFKLEGKDDEFGDLIPLDYDFEEDMIETLENKELENLLSSSNLNEREIDILKHHYGIYDGKEKKFEELGKMYGISRERARQIEIKAFKKIRYSDQAKFYCDGLPYHIYKQKQMRKN